VEMSENWEEWGAMMLGLRKGFGRVFGGDGDGGDFVAFALIKGGCWTR
jgi:hypothetical protein